MTIPKVLLIPAMTPLQMKALVLLPEGANLASLLWTTPLLHHDPPAACFCAKHGE